MSATACHENEFRNQLVYALMDILKTVSVPVGEPIGGTCKSASCGGAPGSNHILSNIMASKRAKLIGLPRTS